MITNNGSNLLMVGHRYHGERWMHNGVNVVFWVLSKFLKRGKEEKLVVFYLFIKGLFILILKYLIHLWFYWFNLHLLTVHHECIHHGELVPVWHILFHFPHPLSLFPPSSPSFGRFLLAKDFHPVFCLSIFYFSFWYFILCVSHRKKAMRCLNLCVWFISLNCTV